MPFALLHFNIKLFSLDTDGQTALSFSYGGVGTVWGNSL
jgi:hypothetical protein